MKTNHYERVITACSFLFLFVNIGFPSSAFGMYQPYLVDLPGMSHTLASAVVSIRALTSLLATFVVARYYKWLDCRIGITVALLMTAAGFVSYGLANDFSLLAVGSVLAGAGYGLGGTVGSTLLVGRWYKTDTGKAAGIAAIGSGFAGIVIPVIAVRVVEYVSLAASFYMQAGIALVIALLVFALLRNKPQDIGMQPFAAASAGSAKAAVKKRPNDAAQLDYDSLPAAAKLGMILAMCFVGATCAGGIAYIGILMTSNGASTVFAATMISVTGVTLCVGKFFAGAVMDALGTRRGSLLFFSILTLSFVFCCMAPLGNEALFVVAAVLFGFGASLGSTGISVWSLDFSHPDSRARVIKNFQAAYACGGFVFNMMPGLLMELTGTYVTTFAIMGVLSLAQAAIVLGIYRMKK